MEEPCLGTYGGPVSPDIVLGGFEGTAYQNASTLIVTFVVYDYKDESKLSKGNGVGRCVHPIHARLR